MNDDKPKCSGWLKGLAIAGGIVGAYLIIDGMTGGALSAFLLPALADSDVPDVPDIPDGCDAIASIGNSAIAEAAACGVALPERIDGEVLSQLDRQQYMLDVQTDIENHRVANQCRCDEIGADVDFKGETGLSYKNVKHPHRLPREIKNCWDRCDRVHRDSARMLRSIGMDK